MFWTILNREGLRDDVLRRPEDGSGSDGGDGAGAAGADGGAVDTGAAPDGAASGDGNDGGGNPEPAWSSIDDESIRGLMETKGYKDYNEVAKAYFHLNKLVKGSTDVVAIPDEGDEDGKRALYERLGAPKSPDGYDIKLPDDAQVDEDFEKTARTWFHSAGLTNEQAATVVNRWQEYVTERMANDNAASERDKEAAVAEIKQKYGQTFDTQLARGQNAVKALGISDDLLDRLEEQIGAPSVIELMVTLGDKIGREDVKIDGINSNGFGMTKSELVARRDVMKGTPEIVNALTDPKDPNHLRYKREWDQIIERLSKS